METKTADDFVCSVSWVKDGSSEHLAIGTNMNEVQLWDVNKGKQVNSALEIAVASPYSQSYRGFLLLHSEDNVNCDTCFFFAILTLD